MARRDGRLVLIRVVMLVFAVYALCTVFTLKAQIKANGRSLTTSTFRSRPMRKRTRVCANRFRPV